VIRSQNHRKNLILTFMLGEFRHYLPLAFNLKTTQPFIWRHKKSWSSSQIELKLLLIRTSSENSQLPTKDLLSRHLDYISYNSWWKIKYCALRVWFPASNALWRQKMPGESFIDFHRINEIKPVNLVRGGSNSSLMLRVEQRFKFCKIKIFCKQKVK